MNKLNIIIYFFVFVFFITLIPSNDYEHFTSGRNKCFDCEKQITSCANAYLAFPNKCFDCEKQIKYTCNIKDIKDINLKNLNKYFSMFGRNQSFNRA